MWLGNGFNNGNAYFSSPTTRDYADGVVDEETGLIKFRNVVWFTSLDHGRRHEPLSLMTEQDNIKFSKHKDVNGVGYQKYANFDAIEVPWTDSIPSDFDGLMGVPISFLSKYSPEQFEVIGNSGALAGPMSEIAEKGTYVQGGPSFYISNGDGTFTRIYNRIVIKHRQVSS
jgi:hypothetical protein